MSKIQISVVIPAFNEEKYIQNSLFSLLKSEQKTAINYEVILVDNNSTDQTVQLAQKFAKGMNLRIIKETKQGRGAARARGFEEAKGEIILSADADTIFYSGWVEFLAKELKKNVVGVTTSCKIVEGPIWNQMLFNLSQPLIMFIYKIFTGHFWLSGFSFGITKEAYFKAGGFNPNLQAQEDTDLSFRVSKLGEIKFIHKPVIFSARRFKDGLVEGYLEYIKSYIQAFVQKGSNVYLDNPR